MPKDSFVHIMMSSDDRQFVGLIATVNSLIQNTKSPKKIFIHILVPIGSRKKLKGLIKKLFKEIVFKFEIVEFVPEKFLLENIYINGNQKYREQIGSVMNFARFYFCQLFPKLKKVIYLDCDLIIRGDISELYKINLGKRPIAAVNIGTFNTIGGFNKGSEYLKNKDKLGIDFDQSVFNAGVFVTNLKYWRKNDLLTRIKDIMLEHKKHRDKGGLYKFGTQPVLNLVFYKNYLELPKIWNFGGLGYMKNIEQQSGFNNAKILHWTGMGKPWEKDGFYKQYWKPYNLYSKKNRAKI